MIRRPPRSTQSRSSAASDVYKRQLQRSDDTARRTGGHGEQLGSARQQLGSIQVERYGDTDDGAEGARAADLRLRAHVLDKRALSEHAVTLGSTRWAIPACRAIVYHHDSPRPATSPHQLSHRTRRSEAEPR